MLALPPCDCTIQSVNQFSLVPKISAVRIILMHVIARTYTSQCCVVEHAATVSGRAVLRMYQLGFYFHTCPIFLGRFCWHHCSIEFTRSLIKAFSLCIQDVPRNCAWKIYGQGGSVWISIGLMRTPSCLIKQRQAVAKLSRALWFHRSSLVSFRVVCSFRNFCE